jgi:hypothetical protein
VRHFHFEFCLSLFHLQLDATLFVFSLATISASDLLPNSDQHGIPGSYRGASNQVAQAHLVSTGSPVSQALGRGQLKLTVSSDAVIKSSKTVTLTSITDEVVVTVHQELLCFFSLYYNAALNGNFLEAKKDCFEVALSGDRLMSFMTWLYTGEISTDKRPVPCLLELYVFADQADILALRREALRRLSKSKSFMPGYNSVMLVLQNVMPESQLYKWMLDAYITHWGPQSDVQDPCPSDSDTDSDHLMAKFVYQAMNGIAIRKMKDQPGCSCCNDVCQYHEHSSKQEWEASM